MPRLGSTQQADETGPCRLTPWRPSTAAVTARRCGHKVRAATALVRKRSRPATNKQGTSTAHEAHTKIKVPFCLPLTPSEPFGTRLLPARSKRLHKRRGFARTEKQGASEARRRRKRVQPFRHSLFFSLLCQFASSDFRSPDIPGLLCHPGYITTIAGPSLHSFHHVSRTVQQGKQDRRVSSLRASALAARRSQHHC